MVPGKMGAPVVEQERQPSFGDMRTDEVLWNIGDPVSADGRINHWYGRVECQLPVNSDPQFTTVLFELPSVEATDRGLPQIDADVIDQFLRRPWKPAPRQIVRRRDGHETPVL